MMSKNILILFTLILYSCSGTKTISYDKARQLNLKKDCKTLLNSNQEIDLKKYYLDIENISNITVYKNLKTIKISQINKTPESFNLSEVESEKFKTLYEIEGNDSVSMVFLNGIPINKNDLINYNVDYDAIKTVSLLRNADSTTLNCSRTGGINVLLIITE